METDSKNMRRCAIIADRRFLYILKRVARVEPPSPGISLTGRRHSLLKEYGLSSSAVPRLRSGTGDMVKLM